jgi:hypothetical protein
MKTATAKRPQIISTYRVGCEAEAPYGRLQTLWLRFLGMALGRHII